MDWIIRYLLTLNPLIILNEILIIIFLSLVVLSTSGFFRGIALSNFTLTVSESVPLERLAAAFGWHMIGKACFVIAFGPLIGKIKFLLEMYEKKY